MQWEYKTVRFTQKSFLTSGLDMQELRDRLNEYGEDGWELVSFNYGLGMWGAGIAVLKRPLK